MSGYLSVDLDKLTIDPALMAQLPPGLAAYYLALPLAREDGIVSVAMAHPENKIGLAVLADLLAAPVVPVQASAAAIREALQRFTPAAAPLPPRVLAWSSDPQQLDLVTELAGSFATALTGAVTVIRSPQLGLESILELAREGQYSLAVLRLPAEGVPAQLLQRVVTPLFLLQGRLPRLRRILIALRGYSADEQLLDWLAPLLQPGTSVTFMPLTSEDASGQAALLGDLQKGHLEDCLHHPALRHSQVWVKFRQGEAVDQLIEETSEGVYDLIVIAAEGYGHFVSRVLGHIMPGMKQGDRRHQPSFFVLKPPTNGEAGGGQGAAGASVEQATGV